MHSSGWRRAMISGLTLLGLLLPFILAQPVLAASGVSRLLAALERDIGAATVQAAALREQLAAAPARPRDDGPATAAEIAGIADGGSAASLAALRQMALALDRRLELLRRATAEAPPERGQIVLIMRAALGAVLWTLEDLPLASDDEAGPAPTRRALLDRLDRALADLDAATAALAATAW